MVRVNLVIHLVKHFYTLLYLQISPFGGIKNERLEIVKTSPDPFSFSLKKHLNKVI